VDALVATLADALVRFDRQLAGDLFEHLQAKAESWEHPQDANLFAPRRRSLARQYIRYRLHQAAVDLESRD
jgi:hypothetical protein